jgi:hypothetical protein
LTLVEGDECGRFANALGSREVDRIEGPNTVGAADFDGPSEIELVGRNDEEALPVRLASALVKR